MDLQQEQLARSLGDGHRVIHGVAGSGKTMVLGYRAEYLARAHAAGKPVLVLCYNEPLAVKLAATMAAKGLSDRVHCVHFHKWARAQLVAYGQTLPANNQSQDAFFADMVQRVITGVDRGHIPTGQYLAVLIDEGHDFAPEWLKLVTQMVDPTTNSLLVLVLMPPLAGLLGGGAAPAEEARPLWQALGQTLLQVAAFIALMLLVGRRVLPWLLWQVVKTGSRELFTLSVIAAAIGIAYGASALFSVSFALGAFFAGTVMRESALSHRAAQESLPQVGQW